MSLSISDSMDQLLDRFDEAWSEPTPPRIEDYLAQVAPEQRLTLLIELVRIDLERRLAAGERVRLEEAYLPRFPELLTDSPAIVTLAKHEYAMRRRNEPELMPAEYLARFPQCQTELVAQLPTLDESRDGQQQQQTADAPAGLDLRGYELIEALGKGGMGEVYRCIDPALGRDLAIKVMMAAHRGHPQAERRFVREARVTGSLQHPSIVPIHNLGRLVDGRLHYTMRLVRGQTFADILQQEAGKPERLPYLLSIFEKICQAVAYAHSKRVLHRDLKPHNVMVGKFGEVQVMDWGLAKVLTSGERGCVSAPSTEDAAASRIVTETGNTPMDLSRAGSGMGTPAYMPPEQALGEWDAVDERADVFALGSILCEIMTGQPAYRGTDGNDVYRRAKRGDMTEALQRLQQCGADTALTALCRECLSLQREERPRDAAAVAKRVAEYQAEVQERLRQAELERVAAETRAREEQARMAAERRASRRLLGLAAAIVVFVLVGLAGLAAGMLALRTEQRRTKDALDQVTAEQAKTQTAWKQTREALNTLTDDVIEEMLGKQPVLGEKEKAFLRKALGFYEQFAAQRGEDEESRAVAAEGQFRVAKLRAFLGENAEAVAGYRAAVLLYEKLVGDFPAVPLYRHSLATSRNNLGLLLHHLGKYAEAESVYREALTLEKELVEQFPAEAQYRVDLAKHQNNWAKLLLDLGRHEESELACREALTLQKELVSEFPVVPQYRMDLATYHNTLGVRFLHQARRIEAKAALLEAVKIQEKLTEEFSAEPQYRSELSASYGNLGLLLHELSKDAEAEAYFHKALTLQEKLVNDFPAVPKYRMSLATFHNSLGVFLRRMNRYKEAEKSLRDALALQELLVRYFPAVPQYRQDLAHRHHNLGNLLAGIGRRVEAEPIYRQALMLLSNLVGEFPSNPHYRVDLASSQNALGALLYDRNKWKDAEAAYRQALELLEKLARDFPDLPQYREDLAQSYCNLGRLLRDKGSRIEAEKAYRKALTLQEELVVSHPSAPKYRRALAATYNGIGILLRGLSKTTEAEAAYRKAMTLREQLVGDYPGVPNYRLDLAMSYSNFGNLLCDRERFQIALEWYGKAIPLLEAILAKNARLALARQSLRNAHSGRADALGHLDRYAEAAKDWLRSAELDDGRMRSHFVLKHSAALAQAGEHRAAVKAVEELLGSPDPKGKPASSGLMLYNAACVYALSSAAGKDDAELRQQYAARAIALLRQAQATGFFKAAKQVEEIKKDTDLDALRQREDFKRFLAELQAAQKKPKS